jgi:hypothetical protein
LLSVDRQQEATGGGDTWTPIGKADPSRPDHCEESGNEALSPIHDEKANPKPRKLSHWISEHIMQLPPWLSSGNSSLLTIVRGGSHEALRDLMWDEAAGALTVIGSRAVSDELLCTANVENRVRPVVIISRGLAADVEHAILTSNGRCCLITASVFEAWLRDERRRTVMLAGTLAGYTPAAATVSAVVFDRTFGLLQAFAQRLVDPMVLHDRGSELPRQNLPGLATFEYAGTPRTASVPSLAPPLDAPAPRAVEAHARFLASTDNAVLCQMHTKLAGPESRALFEYWDDQLAALSADPSLTDLIEAARRSLGSVQARLQRPPETRVNSPSHCSNSGPQREFCATRRPRPDEAPAGRRHDVSEAAEMDGHDRRADPWRRFRAS